MTGGFRGKILRLNLTNHTTSTIDTSHYEEYGGVPLLGVSGISIICHGSSTGKAIKNALCVAENMGAKKVNEHISQTLKTREDS